MRCILQLLLRVCVESPPTRAAHARDRLRPARRVLVDFTPPMSTPRRPLQTPPSVFLPLSAQETGRPTGRPAFPLALTPPRQPSPSSPRAPSQQAFRAAPPNSRRGASPYCRHDTRITHPACPSVSLRRRSRSKRLASSRALASIRVGVPRSILSCLYSAARKLVRTRSPLRPCEWSDRN